MLDRFTKLLLVLIALALWSIALRPVLMPHPARAQSAAAAPAETAKDNEELKRLCAEDQSDRTPPEGKPLDWAMIGPRDRARLKRVKELYTQNLLRTANDYDCAATVLLHGDVPEDFLLAHEFWVVAIIKGKNDSTTRIMAATAEDRYLMNIGRPQRFGTQARSENNGPMQLYPVDAGVTDGLRRVMGIRSMAEIKARVAEMNRK